MQIISQFTGHSSIFCIDAQVEQFKAKHAGQQILAHGGYLIGIVRSGGVDLLDPTTAQTENKRSRGITVNLSKIFSDIHDKTGICIGNKHLGQMTQIVNAFYGSIVH